MRYLKYSVTNLIIICILLCIQSCASFFPKKGSKAGPNQDAIAAARAFESFDDDLPDAKKVEDVQTDLSEEDNLFKQYDNDYGGSRYTWFYDIDEYYDENSTPYKELQKNIRLSAQKEALAEIKVEIKSILVDKQLTNNKNYESFTMSQIEARVSGVLRSDYWKSEFRPPLHKIKKGDSLEFIGRFDKVAYKERLEDEKQKNEKLAKESFERAHDSYSKGILNKCLEDLAVCHYYIFSGGNNIEVQDPIADRKAPVIDALFSLVDEINNNITIDVLDEEGFEMEKKKKEFIKSAVGQKNLSIQMEYYPSDNQPYQDLGGLRIRLVDSIDGQEEIVNIGESRKINYEISDLLKNNEKSQSDWYLRLDISLNLAPDSEGVRDWKESDSYEDFMKRLLNEKIIIEDVAFPLQKIVFIDELCDDCETLEHYLDIAKNEFRQIGGEYFKDMLGEEDISGTVLKKLEKAYKEKQRFEDDYGLDGIVVIKFHKMITPTYAIEEIEITYYGADNLLTHKIQEGVKKYEVNGISETVVKDAVKNFFDNHLYRTISFMSANKGVELKVERLRNNQPVEGTLKTFKHKEKVHYPDQGRYSDLQFRFSAEGYRAEVMEIEASYIDYSNVFPKRSQDVYEINARPIQLKKAQGIADIIIKSDNKSMLYKENTRSNIEIKIGKKVNAYSFRKKWDKPIFGKTSHRYENGIGRYFIKVSAPGFQKQPVAKFDIVDGEDKVIDIELKYKSKLQAFMWSSLMPGTGHVYMQKGTLKNNFIPLGIYSLSLAAAIKYHSSYQGHRSDFLNYQKQFTVSTDRMLSDENRKMAKESWGQMQDAKNYFIGMTASAILTNLVTSIMLMVTS